jgi:hypothetical protein
VCQLKFHWNVSFAGGSLVANSMQGGDGRRAVKNLPVLTVAMASVHLIDLVLLRFPLMLICTAISFSVFRGKVASSASGN